MSNMDLYDAVRCPPKDAMKQIGAGRLKGKSDINPQWRIEALTRQFGPCGTGWTVKVVRVWSESYPSNGEVMAHAEVELRYRTPDGWSDPLPGYGGNKLVTKETNGLHVSDEGYKMAITDAISTAAKLLGVAGDVYRGTWDDSKYSKPQAARGKEGGSSKVKKEDVSTDRDTATDGGAGGLDPTKQTRPPNGSKKTKKAANPQTACKWAYADSAKNLGTDAKVLGTAFAKWLGFAAVAVGGDAAALMDKPNDPRWAKLAILAGNPSYTTKDGEWVPGDVGQDVQELMNHVASEFADQKELPI